MNNIDSSTRPKAREKLFFFVFYGRQRPIETLKGISHTGGIVFEARAYPSLEYAMGESWEDAKENLRDLLNREITNAKDGANAWYDEKVNQLCDQDRKALYAAAFKALTDRKNQEPTSFGQTTGIIFDEIEGDEDCSTTQEEPCSGKV